MDTSTTPPHVVTELSVDDAWDRLLDTTLRRGVYGGLAGGLAALVFFRGPGARAAMTTFGAGWGLGSAYEASRRELATIFPRAPPSATGVPR